MKGILITATLSFLVSFQIHSQERKIFKFYHNKKPIDCQCQIKENGEVIKKIRTKNGQIDLTEICSERSDAEVHFLPDDPMFSGNYFLCKSASPVIRVYSRDQWVNINFNASTLLEQDSSNIRYRFIVAGARTEMAEIYRRLGNYSKADSLESSVVSVITPVFKNSTSLIYNDLEQNNKLVLSNEGKKVIQAFQSMIGTNPDGILGIKTFSEAAQFPVYSLYENTEWIPNKISPLIDSDVANTFMELDNTQILLGNG